MTERFELELKQLTEGSRLRELPEEPTVKDKILDFTSNDYLGIASRKDLQQKFLELAAEDESAGLMSSSAARLLHIRPKELNSLERVFGEAYGGKEALCFNSGYHANVGMLSALGDKRTLIVADKLVHASCIDGAMLSRANFKRFPHNDTEAAASIIEKEKDNYETIVLVAESVYSMDGDYGQIGELAEVRLRYPNVLLYVDEAHAIGVEGPSGLGVTETLEQRLREGVDIRVLTLGKALCSMGAIAITDKPLKSYMVNKARSFIFSTALPPINARWSRETFLLSMGMDSERRKLKALGKLAQKELTTRCGRKLAGHIMPVYFECDQAELLRISRELLEHDIKVMAIRPPTVPEGTHRLRVSFSASQSESEVKKLAEAINKIRL